MSLVSCSWIKCVLILRACCCQKVFRTGYYKYGGWNVKSKCFTYVQFKQMHYSFTKWNWRRLCLRISCWKLLKTSFDASFKTADIKINQTKLSAASRISRKFFSWMKSCLRAPSATDVDDDWHFVEKPLNIEVLAHRLWAKSIVVNVLIGWSIVERKVQGVLW